MYTYNKVEMYGSVQCTVLCKREKYRKTSVSVFHFRRLGEAGGRDDAVHPQMKRHLAIVIGVVPDSSGCRPRRSAEAMVSFLLISAAVGSSRGVSEFTSAREAAGGQQAMASKLAALYFGREIQWLAVLFGLSAVVFAINAYRSYRRTAVRTECRRIGRPVVHFEIVSAFVGDIAMNHLAHRARY